LTFYKSSLKFDVFDKPFLSLKQSPETIRSHMPHLGKRLTAAAFPAMLAQLTGFSGVLSN